jgi:hypothetical protein
VSHFNTPKEGTMSHTAYKLALIRRDQLLREAADRRLATELAPSVERAASGTAFRFRRLVRAPHTAARLTARGS